MTGQTWREGWWPLDPHTEAYLKQKVLTAEPTAKFFYSAEFKASVLAAEAERTTDRTRKRTSEEAPAERPGGYVDAGWRPMTARMIAYYYGDEADDTDEDSAAEPAGDSRGAGVHGAPTMPEQAD